MSEKENKKVKEKRVLTKDEVMTRIWTIWNIVEAVLLVGAGVIAILFGVEVIGGENADHNLASLILGIVVGAFIILDGVLRFFMSVTKFRQYKTDESTTLVSAFEITIGITLILVYETFLNTAIYFVATLLTVVGTLMIINAVLTIIRKERSLTVPILTIVFSAILIGLGIAIYILHSSNNEGFAKAINVALGVILILVGGALTGFTLVQLHKMRKEREAAKKAEKEEKKPEAIEVDATDKEEKQAIEHKEEAPKEPEEPKNDDVIDVIPEDEKPEEKPEDKPEDKEDKPENKEEKAE